MNWVDRDAAVVWHGFTQMAAYPDNDPVIVDHADGHHLVDVDGRRYLDAISSLWVNTLGHRVPELDAALLDQVGRVAHSTMLGNGNRAVIELAEALAQVVPIDQPHFLFASDGAAAVEQALKIAFQYWANRGQPRRTYLALGDAYHGDTVGALSLGADGFGSEIFDPLRFPVIRVPGPAEPGWGDTAMRTLEERPGELAALVFEPLVQGAGGIIVGDPDDYSRLGRRCQELGVLLVCDEVATGFGRTGQLFASTACGLRPDIMCLGKGITGGYLPMSATAVTETVYRQFLGDDLGSRTFYHGHSYGGNALAAAVALRHLQLIEEWHVLDNVAARSAQLGDLLTEQIKPLGAVSQIRQCGLMAGVELRPQPGIHVGRRVCAAAVRRGVLLRPLGDVVVLMPLLTTTEAEIREIVDVLEASIHEVVTA